jgi:hypothetical protein
MSDDIYNMIVKEQEQSNPQTQETKVEAPFDKEKWAAEKKAEREEVYARIDATTQRISDDPTMFRDYLDVMARFPRHSVANTLLIHDQSPDATRLGDFDSWKARGESVKRGESAIAILEPGDEYTRDDGSIGVSYNVRKVFDAKQTSARHLEPRHPEIREALLALICKTPIPVKTVDAQAQTEGARYDHEAQTIFVVSGLEPPELFKALAVEMAHADLVARQGTFNQGQQVEDAQLIGYVVAKRFGVDVSDRMPTISPVRNDEDRKEAREQLGRVRDSAKSISDRMSKTLEASKTQESGSKPKVANRSDRDVR